MNIPDAAIRAAAQFLDDHYDDAGQDTEEHARAILSAALPHLGENETTYTTRIQHSGGTLVQEEGASRDLASAQARAARLNWGPNVTIAVVQRTVYWSEWTEVET